MRIALTCALLVSMVSASGCASIVSRSTYPVTLDTRPSGLDIEVEDADGQIVYRGGTPAQVHLDAADGFFLRAIYTMRVRGGAASTPSLRIRPAIDGWYFGNLLLGGVIGMLIVDPITGAMFALDKIYILDIGGDASVD